LNGKLSIISPKTDKKVSKSDIFLLLAQKLRIGQKIAKHADINVRLPNNNNEPILRGNSA
jgi:hypothetical protein